LDEHNPERLDLINEGFDVYDDSVKLELKFFKARDCYFPDKPRSFEI
jgi:hypothetical protein